MGLLKLITILIIKNRSEYNFIFSKSIKILNSLGRFYCLYSHIMVISEHGYDNVLFSQGQDIRNNAAIEIISALLALKGQNNFWVLKVFLICDFLFITWFFYKCFYYPSWLKYLSMLMLLFMGFFLIFTNKLALREGLFFLSIFLFSIILSVQAFVSLLDNSEPLGHPVFWIALSRFVYFIFIFIIFVYPSKVPECYKNHLFSLIQPLIISSANLLGNILLGGTFLCKKIQI